MTIAAAIVRIAVGVAVSGHAPAEPQATHLVDMEEFADCPAVSLAVLLRCQERAVSLGRIRSELSSGSQQGVTAGDLCELATRLGTALIAVSCDAHTLSRLAPCIVHLRATPQKPAHYCVLWDAGPDRYVVIDPPHSVRTMESSRFTESWSRTALVPASTLARISNAVRWIAGVECATVALLGFGLGRLALPAGRPVRRGCRKLGQRLVREPGYERLGTRT